MGILRVSQHLVRFVAIGAIRPDGLLPWPALTAMGRASFMAGGLRSREPELFSRQRIRSGLRRRAEAITQKLSPC